MTPARGTRRLELHDLLLDLHGNGNDLVIEPAGILGGAGLLLGSGGELVLLLAGDAPDVVDVLSGGAHVVVVVSVPQAVLDHGVDQLLVTHAGAPAGIQERQGAALMFSVPPQTTTSASPARMERAASMTDFMPEPQTMPTV